ncbi:MAG TPA: stalk domain-containing protein [Candidatus Elarobacter sp.]|nr:stalk domain-containing protein [Candidatus Elarobacter sp.]
MRMGRRLVAAGVLIALAGNAALAGSAIGKAKLVQQLRHVAQSRVVALLTVRVDGDSLGAIGVQRAAGTPLVPLDVVANALGWRVVTLADGMRLSGDDRSVVVTAGSRIIRENGESRLLFAEAVVSRGGRLYLDAADVTRLFGVRSERANGALVFVRPAQIGTPARIVEIARPPAPQPSPTPRSAVRRLDDTAPASATAGRIVLALDRVGSTRLLHISSETKSGTLQTALTSSGVNDFGTPNATVIVGSAQRNVALGMLTDPLGGTIFRGTVYEGVALGRGDRTLFAGRRLADGTDLTGMTFGDALHGGSTTIATVWRNGAYDQTIVRRLRRARHPWGDFSTEVLAGDKGVGIGFAARTRGRTFFEADAAYATRGLPLGPNDAPVNVDIGRELSAATTAVVGLSTGPRQPLAPFVGISTRTHGLLASASVSDRTLTASLAYQSANASLQAYSVPGPQRAGGVQGTLAFPGAVLDLTATSAAGTRDAALTLRTTRRGLNVIGGVGFPSAGRIAPIAGLSVPVTPLLMLEGTVRPAGATAHAVRLGLAMGIPARRKPSVPMVDAVIHVGGDASARMRLFVDGVPSQLAGAPVAHVAVTRGPHVFAVETDDGTRGSPDVGARIDAPGDGVTLPLWPFRTVRGRVVVSDRAVWPPDASFAGITISIEPDGSTVETAADGTFMFPKLPLAPGATIAVAPGSLPRELHAPDRQPLPEGDVTLILGPGLRIERQTFPASH